MVAGVLDTALGIGKIHGRTSLATLGETNFDLDPYLWRACSVGKICGDVAHTNPKKLSLRGVG